MTPFEQELLGFQDLLIRYAMKITGNKDRAEDLVQDTLLKAIDKQDQFQPGSNMAAWLITVMRNLFLSGIRREGRVVEDPDDFLSLRLSIPPPQDSYIDLQDVSEIFDTLSDRQQRALYLVGALGYQYEEAAAILDEAAGTIKSQVNRARKKIHEIAARSPTPA